MNDDDLPDGGSSASFHLHSAVERIARAAKLAKGCDRAAIQKFIDPRGVTYALITRIAESADGELWRERKDRIREIENLAKRLRKLLDRDGAWTKREIESYWPGSEASMQPMMDSLAHTEVAVWSSLESRNWERSPQLAKRPYLAVDFGELSYFELLVQDYLLPLYRACLRIPTAEPGPQFSRFGQAVLNEMGIKKSTGKAYALDTFRKAANKAREPSTAPPIVRAAGEDRKYRRPRK